jgi:hypothetical protein
MPVVIRDFEVVADQPDRPPPSTTAAEPAPPAPSPSVSRLEQALRRMRQRALRVHAD